MKIPDPVVELTETQKATWDRIFSLPKEDQPKALLKWALARIVFYGTMNEPCANAIRVYLNDEQVE